MMEVESSAKATLREVYIGHQMREGPQKKERENKKRANEMSRVMARAANEAIVQESDL